MQLSISSWKQYYTSNESMPDIEKKWDRILKQADIKGLKIGDEEICAEVQSYRAQKLRRKVDVE